LVDISKKEKIRATIGAISDASPRPAVRSIVYKTVQSEEDSNIVTHGTGQSEKESYTEIQQSDQSVHGLQSGTQQTVQSVNESQSETQQTTQSKGDSQNKMLQRVQSVDELKNKAVKSKAARSQQKELQFAKLVMVIVTVFLLLWFPYMVSITLYGQHYFIWSALLYMVSITLYGQFCH